jgi:YHS domain-containing protein
MVVKMCPVCGMRAKPNITSLFQGRQYLFCCPLCKNKFDENPQAFVKGQSYG